MTGSYVWIVIAIFQAVFLLLFGTLRYVTLDRRRVDEGDRRMDAAAAARLAASRFWWRRMQAARWLSGHAQEGDKGVIRRLLQDPHPGVQSAATACLLRYADEELVSLILDGLASRSEAVQLYQSSVLRRCSTLTLPLLLTRLRGDTLPDRLRAYITLAESLDSPDCLERIAVLSIHPNADVRVAVARVLQRFQHDSGAIKLLAMLRDPDWRVRAQAARGLGAAGDERAIPELTRALTDRSWWVRFRAALALAALGERGLAALDGARDLSDRYARDMASFVTGLSASSVAELSEG